MSGIKGILIPIGGNEDKGLGKDESHTLDFIEDGILSHVVREGGGPTMSILIIPTASSIPEKVGQNYRDAFGKLGCQNVRVMDVRTKDKAHDPETIAAFMQANIIMFSGGDQSKIAKYIGQSPLKSILHDRYVNEPIVIAGTSAGAMAMSEQMIAGGSSTEAMFKGSVRMRKGLGLLDGVIIDSHFIQRGRFNRIPEALSRFPDRLGIGLAEDTAMVIYEGHRAKVIGSGMIIVFDPSELTHNNQRLLAKGTPMSMCNLKVHILVNGDTIDLSTRAVCVLPFGSAFE